jgi:hypothetical protein
MPPDPTNAVDPTVSTVSETVKRAGRGKFAAGARPGPGRPKGERARLAAALDSLASTEAEAVLAAVVAAAKGGDMTAARIVLERLWPVPKGRALELDLPPVENATGLVSAMAALVAAMADGTVTPDEAKVIAGVLSEQRAAIETADLAERLQTLEEAAPLLDEDGDR